MGLLGISVKGSLSIQTDRPTYHPGDSVHGMVTLVVHEPIDCGGAYVIDPT
ncbi:hypothetical protein PINS_up012288 [Pythium insidiosum]|nr:hypothetical protein PINS_up012288 [Pythium insidiosum]